MIKRTLCFTFIALVLMGCSTAQLHISLATGKALNEDPQHHALPVVVRLYQLKHADAIRQASFWRMWHTDREVLGESFISSRELSLMPGHKREVALNYEKGASYLAAVAIFRQPLGLAWRAIVPLSPTGEWLPQHIHFTLNHHKIKEVHS